MNGLDNIIGFLIFVVVAIFIMVVQALGRLAQKGQPQRPGPQRPGPQRPPAQEADLNDQIGDFLRQAARRRQQEEGPPAAARGQPGDRVVRAEVVGGRRPARPEVLREQARAAARRQAKAATAARRGPQREAPVPPTLAPKSEPAPEAPRVALPSVFAAAQSAPAAGGAPAAAHLYAVLSEPANLRQAILLAEVLNRPEDRW